MKNLKVKSFLFGLIIIMGAVLFMPSCEPPDGPVLHDCDMEGPMNFDFDETADFYANDVPGALYYWEVPECMTIIPDGDPSDRFITVSGSPNGCQGQVALYICTNDATPPDEDYCSYCFMDDVRCNPQPPSCCFEYQAVPKYFPSCFTECTGGLDNTWEILQTSCEPLPDGFVSAFANVTLNSSTSLGNCGSCSNPITSLTEPQTSFNLAVCGSLNHSISFDINVYDGEGNLVYVCPDKYFSFNVPECE